MSAANFVLTDVPAEAVIEASCVVMRNPMPLAKQERISPSRSVTFEQFSSNS